MIGDDGAQFTYLEYQTLLLCLAGVMCASLGIMEFILKRFEVLTLIFPGMFSIRSRRFYYFSHDITEGNLGKQIRGDAKMLVRITVCVLLSYLWQHLVLISEQQIGTEFPSEQCDQGADCFSSKLQVSTLFNRDYRYIDCDGPRADFQSREVVSCIRFVQPSATHWFMHIAIAHSVTQLNFKAYEICVWATGAYTSFAYLVAFFGVASMLVFGVGMFFVDLVSEFISSWLSFVMCVSLPLFLYTVWRSGRSLAVLSAEEARQLQLSIEDHFNKAFPEIEAEDQVNLVEPRSKRSQVSARMARAFGSLSWTSSYNNYADSAQAAAGVPRTGGGMTGARNTTGEISRGTTSEISRGDGYSTTDDEADHQPSSEDNSTDLSGPMLTHLSRTNNPTYNSTRV